jgi:hypothetical protein
MNENDRIMLEEQEHLVNSHHLPPIKREWTIGTVLSFAGSLAGLACWVLSTLFGFQILSITTILLVVAFLLFAAAASVEFDKKISELRTLPANIVPLGLALWAGAVLLTSQHLLPS